MALPNPQNASNIMAVDAVPPHRQRYAGFDDETFSLYTSGSSAQAKRALEAHLVETERRLQEASQLGSSLLQQRKELSSRLKDVQDHDDDEDIGPELRQKLQDLEREFNEVGKEAARAFIPRSRVPSNESANGGDASMLESGGRESPTKPQAPSLSSRKQRNAAPSRMNDIKLATEISSSLLNQIRELQAAYAEKDDALRAALLNQSSLETEREGLFQRLKALDESEQRYKDENWALETRVQELGSSTREFSEREQKLQQSIKIAQLDRSNVERELEELKQAHGKLNDDHSVARKHHEAELLVLRKDVTTKETDRAALEKRINDLSTQNHELAQAMAYKLRGGDSSIDQDLSMEDDVVDAEGLSTPEHSPPPSPTKGTPRHGGLESETLKSSLHHAHRMIQNLKNNIHREKTEKLELRRMLSATQDELEQRKNDGGNGANRRKKAKDDVKEFKKPARPDKLGGNRGPTSEIVMDEDWEDDNHAHSPSWTASANMRSRNLAVDTDAFETANEKGDSSDFETATEHERETESEAFHTGAESLDGESSGEQTETEGPVKSVGQRVVSKKGHDRTQSFQSTASTDDDLVHVTTPVQQTHFPNTKPRLSRPRSSRRAPRSAQLQSESPTALKDSPASFANTGSNPSTPQGPSLFAELGDFSGSEGENSTPGKSSVGGSTRNPTPQQPHKELTDGDGTPASAKNKDLLSRSKTVLGAALAGGLGLTFGRKASEENHANADIPDTTPMTASARGENDVEDRGVDNSQILSLLTPPKSSDHMAEPAPKLALADIASQHTEPQSQESRANNRLTALFSKSPIDAQYTGPQEAQANAIKTEFSLSSFASQSTVPTEAPRSETRPLTLGASGIAMQHTEPVQPLTMKPDLVSTPAKLSLSNIVQQYAQEPILPVLRQDLNAAPGVFTSDPSRGAFEGGQVEDPSTPTASRRPSAVQRQDSQDSATLPPPIPARSPRSRSSYVANQDEATKDFESRAARRKSTDSSRGGFFGMLGFGKSKTSEQPQIAEDGTSTAIRQTSTTDDMSTLQAGGSRVPLGEIEPNYLPEQRTDPVMGQSKAMLPSRPVTLDEGTQTTFSAEEFDRLLASRDGNRDVAPTNNDGSVARIAGVYRPTSSQNRSRESLTPGQANLMPGVLPRSPRRPGSSGSGRGRTVTPPPLPVDHREAIAAAARGAPAVPANSNASVMGPPLMPASAYRTTSHYRPSNPATGRVYGTVRTSIHGVPTGSGRSSPVTRRSSVSSFASEIDQRFNIADGRSLMFDPAVDPRMIQAITQTMIGEFLWKYTRKPGRETVSSTRHRRYFWLHPYNRTLYWSESSPVTAGRAQAKAKSVKIQSVRVVPDDNPLPPGLHRKSLVVSTPGREIQFTAATSTRHEAWFNALSYLLLRSENDPVVTAGDTNGITAEDVEEFNAGFGRGRGGSRRSRASLSSYNSRATRVAQHDHPTLTPNDRPPSRRSTVRRGLSPGPGAMGTANRGSVSSRLSTLAGSLIGGGGGSFSSRHSLRSDGVATTIGDATTLHADGSSGYAGSIIRSSHDSAEDLRRVIERQDRDADRLENVRACCDGKHDVGSLSHGGRHRHSTMTVGRSNRGIGSASGRTTPVQGGTVAGPSRG